MTTHAMRLGNVTKGLAVALAVVGGGPIGAGPAAAAGGPPPTISVQAADAVVARGGFGGSVQLSLLCEAPGVSNEVGFGVPIRVSVRQASTGATASYRGDMDCSESNVGEAVLLRPRGEGFAPGKAQVLIVGAYGDEARHLYVKETVRLVRAGGVG